MDQVLHPTVIHISVLTAAPLMMTIPESEIDPSRHLKRWSISIQSSHEKKSVIANQLHQLATTKTTTTASTANIQSSSNSSPSTTSTTFLPQSQSQFQNQCELFPTPTVTQTPPTLPLPVIANQSAIPFPIPPQITTLPSSLPLLQQLQSAQESYFHEQYENELAHQRKQQKLINRTVAGLYGLVGQAIQQHQL